MLIKNNKGFTLVELALAMAFVGVLSVSIVLIISNTVSAYQRGITLTRVNSVGTDLVNDIRASISNSSAKNISSICESKMFKGGSESLSNSDIDDCKENNAYNYIYVVKNKDVGGEKTIPIFGAFCTGDYSYIWNSGYFISGDNMDLDNEWVKLYYLDSDGELQQKEDYFKMIKVKDSSRSVCVAMRNVTDHEYDGVTNRVDISAIGSGLLESGGLVELLPNDGGNNLALYDLYVAEPAVSLTGENMFYSVSFVLGTVTGGANIMASGNSCAAPQGLAMGNSNYCAINKFNFAMQVNGGK